MKSHSIQPIKVRCRPRPRPVFRQLPVRRAAGALLACLLALSCLPARSMSGLHLESIRLPENFSIHVFAGNVPGARSLAPAPGGVVFVGTRDEGKVYALVDRDGDHRSDRVHVIAQGLRMPNGVAFRDGALYVAEVHRVLRFDDILPRLESPPEPVVINAAFPTDGHHGWKYIAFGPDGWLYVPVGAPCNVCERENPVYASILRMKSDGTGLEIFARGIRNTVGFDWHPESGVLWFTNNGRDWMGDDLPPDSLHRAPEKGMHFGFPYCHAGDIPDPEYGSMRSCAEFSPPSLRLPAHVAPLGMTFYTGNRFPEAYRNQIFIAEHGSWNRTEPVGYRITLARFSGRRAIRYEVFADGWLQGERAWGRPVDVAALPDGSLLISDDRSGAVYRIDYAP